MPSFNPLDVEILACQKQLQQIRQLRLHNQRALWRRAQAPVLLMSGLWFGATLQTWSQARLQHIYQQNMEQVAMPNNAVPVWLLILWRWWMS